MEFRLIYRGRLPAQPSDESKSRAEVKHTIRQALHPQLRELWNAVPRLSQKMVLPQGQSEADLLADNYALGPFRFLPLVTKENGLACAIDITFLRRDNPGSLIVHGGDIDNRIKVLFDALKRPTENSELVGFTPTSDENPFFCLLEDDRLITDISVTTDRLLLPMESDEKIHDVLLVIKVRTKVIDPDKAEYEFLAD